MATHSSILAWEIPWTEEPGGLQSMGSQTVRHVLATEHTLVQANTFSCFSVLEITINMPKFPTFGIHFFSKKNRSLGLLFQGPIFLAAIF